MQIKRVDGKCGHYVEIRGYDKMQIKRADG